MKKDSSFSLTIDGRFYYGWVMLLCGFMSLFICYVIKANCYAHFVAPICADLGISRTAYIQTNSIMTVAMLVSSLFIGKVYNKYSLKYVLTGCIVITSACYLGMSRSTALWQLIILSGIQGIGWSGATNLPATIMVGRWFGPKVKGTALSITMLGSGAGALVWVNVINRVIQSYGWRTGYVAMAGINAIMIPIALFLAVSYPSDKGYARRIGDPTEEEVKATGVSSGEASGITGMQAVKTLRWWLQWIAGMLTMVGVAAFSAQFIDYYSGIADKNTATVIYSSALGTLIFGMFLVGLLCDVLNVRRMAVIAPLFSAAVFACIALSSKNMVYAKILIPLYMIGGAVPGTIPFLITARNFGDKEYGVMAGWMNCAGNMGQIIGPTVAAFIFDTTGSYVTAWYIFAALSVVVSILYFLSGIVSQKKIEAWGYKPV